MWFLLVRKFSRFRFSRSALRLNRCRNRSGHSSLAQEFTTEKLKNIKAAGGLYIIDVCPFCHLQFDRGQKGSGYNIPVIHLAQLYGLAFGLPKTDLGLEAHEVKVVL